MMKRIP